MGRTTRVRNLHRTSTSDSNRIPQSIFCTSGERYGCIPAAGMRVQYAGWRSSQFALRKFKVTTTTKAIEAGQHAGAERGLPTYKTSRRQGQRHPRLGRQCSQLVSSPDPNNPSADRILEAIRAGVVWVWEHAAAEARTQSGPV